MKRADLFTELLIRQRAVRLLVAGILFTLLVACSQNLLPTPQSTTGEAVAPEFEQFYGQHEGLRTMGFPHSSPYIDPNNQRLVQYFQRMRLEYDTVTGEIIVSPLGELLMPDETEWVRAEVPEGGQSQTISDSIYPVQDEFLAFYDQFGGQELFGLPISPQLNEGGTRVQYFQNARLEWQPDAALEFRVRPGFLGKEHYYSEGFIPADSRAALVDSAAIRQVNVRAVFKAPVLYSGDEQVIFVTLNAADGLSPVGDVAVKLLINYNDGSTETMDLPNTDRNGQTQGVLPATFHEAVEAGQKVEVQVTAISPVGLEIGRIITSFTTWW